MLATQECLVTDIETAMPVLAQLTDLYVSDLADVPEAYVHAANVGSNPLLPGFAKYAVLKSLGYPVLLTGSPFETTDEEEDSYENYACAVYIEPGSEAARIMISPAAWPTGDKPPFAVLTEKMADRHGDGVQAKYILGERYSYYELCRTHEEMLDARNAALIPEEIDEGVGDRADPYLLELKESDRLTPEELAAVWKELLPDAKRPDGTHDPRAAEQLYKRAFMTYVLAHMTDEERYGEGLRIAAQELYQADESWRLYDTLCAEGVRPLGHEEIYGIISSQIQFARAQLAAGKQPAVGREYLI